MADVRFGSKGDIRPLNSNVRFTPESRHRAAGLQCPLRAMCGRLRRQGLSSRLQHWSVQPCVRPVSAAHAAAGHNALRGSGPGHKHAFDNALARVGCPDRQIDRLCITCCSPSQPSHHAGCPARSRFKPQARRVPCIAHPWPSWPRPCVQSCWQARWRQPLSADVSTTT